MTARKIVLLPKRVKSILGGSMKNKWLNHNEQTGFIPMSKKVSFGTKKKKLEEGAKTKTLPTNEQEKSMRV